MAKTPAPETCLLRTHARLVSLNGGIVLSLCILLSSLAVAMATTQRFAPSQAILFIALAVASWIYLFDGASESLSLSDHSLVRSSRFGRESRIKLVELKSLILRHEGLNPSLGIESLTATFRDGHEERIALGPCWRRSDLETFLDSVEKEMGFENLVESRR